MKLYIRYMVSIRCKMIVKSELENLGLHYSSVELGAVEIKENISAEQREQLNIALKKSHSFSTPKVFDFRGDIF